MSKDLEETLRELGPDASALVGRLRAAREVAPSRCLVPPLRSLWRRTGLLAAAVAVVVLAAAVVLRERPSARRAPAASLRVYTIAYAPTEEALELLVASQRADGSWGNDFLTRQNAAALRASEDIRMKIAYRRAVRYLRAKGLAPLTDSELKSRGEYAARVLAGA